MDSKDKLVCCVICICGILILGPQISETSATSKTEKNLISTKNLPYSSKDINLKGNSSFGDTNDSIQAIRIHRKSKKSEPSNFYKQKEKKSQINRVKIKNFREVKTFDIIIGQTTKDDLFRKQAILSSNKWFADNSYSVLQLNSQLFPIDDVKSKNAYVIVNSEGIVEAFGLTINAKEPKDTFYKINRTLRSKYSLVYKKIPFAGELFVKYKKNDVNIILNTPRLNNETFLTYATENILRIETNYLKQDVSPFKSHTKEIL